ncbi:MAG: terpene cyclase/mutase family protein, partial [Thermomicrobiaceae bacterium]|nr:terpene cyclase/mutase family protein [Thermomicrobiaceae bacterium]
PNTGLYDAQQLYVDAYALLALHAAGVDVPAEAIDALEQRQAQNGGWAWNGSPDQSQADSNTTSVVVQALIAAGESRDADTINKALGYLRAAQLDDGSFVYQIGAESPPVGDANSTALAVQALVAAGENPASDDWKHATAALAHFQNASGAFRYRDDVQQDNLLATAQAVPALELKPLPIQPGPGFGRGGPLQLAMQPARPKTGCDYFTKTEHNVCAGFRAYWQHFGGLPNFGYPLTEEFVDPATGLTVQYFERARFEWHPGAWPARYDVLLDRLGAELTRQRAATDPAFQPHAESANPSCVYVAVTRHNLCAGFRAYWERFGGLPVFGYPISDAFVQDGMVVQYFERARFEWHPGAWPERYDVLLGRLGAEEIGLR